MNRPAWRYLPAVLYLAVGLAVVLYTLDTLRVIDFSLAVNQLALDEARRVCTYEYPTFEAALR